VTQICLVSDFGGPQKVYLIDTIDRATIATDRRGASTGGWRQDLCAETAAVTAWVWPAGDDQTAQHWICLKLRQPAVQLRHIPSEGETRRQIRYARPATAGYQDKSVSNSRHELFLSRLNISIFLLNIGSQHVSPAGTIRRFRTALENCQWPQRPM